MYEALFLIVLAGLGLALSITVSKSYGIWRQVIVYIPVILFALLGLVRRKLENRVRSIPAATEELTQIHHQICKAWRERLLPNF